MPLVLLCIAQFVVVLDVTIVAIAAAPARPSPTPRRSRTAPPTWCRSCSPPRWAEQVVVDGGLVTGQNPASARRAAEEVVALLRAR